MRLGSSCIAILALATETMAQPASQTSAAAEAQFEKARELRADGKWPEACVAFEDSEKLDPQSGTLFNLAECDAHIGKLASAWAAYRNLAQRDTNVGRRALSIDLANKLEPRLPKLAVSVTPAVTGLALTMNGIDATSFVGIESPIDLGHFELVATAPGFERWTKTIDVTEEAKTVTVAIALRRSEPTDVSVRASVAPAPAVAPEPVASSRRPYAIGSVALGGALVIGGLVAGKLANDKWSAAQGLCPDQTCAPGDLSRASSLADEARTRATVADVLIAAAAVGVGVGIYLFVAPSHAETATAMRVVAGPTSVSLIGGF